MTATTTLSASAPVDLPCACTTLRKATRAVARLYEGHLGAVGLTATQFAILRAIERREPYNLRPLADELVMDRTSLYRAIAPLERDGLVAIEADGSDARARRASLTDAGRTRIAEALPHWRAAQHTFIEGFGAADYEGFIGELRHAIALLETSAARAGHASVATTDTTGAGND